MTQGKVSLILDLASFSLILAYSCKVSCLGLLEVMVFSLIVLIV